MRNLEIVHKQEIPLFQDQADFLLVDDFDKLIEKLTRNRRLIAVNTRKIWAS